MLCGNAHDVNASHRIEGCCRVVETPTALLAQIAAQQSVAAVYHYWHDLGPRCLACNARTSTL